MVGTQAAERKSSVANLVRVSIQGIMPNGEVWSVNPCFRLNAPTAVSNDELIAAAAQIALVAIPNGLLALQSTSTRVSGLRLEARDNNGDLEAWADNIFGTSVAGSGSTSHPYQTSAVFSLRTPGPAASGRGRVYWPATGAAMDGSSLRLSSSVVSGALTGFRTYMVAIQGAITTNVSESILAVWSRKLSTTFGVTSIQAGDVADTQRRRRDAVPESYAALSYPT